MKKILISFLGFTVMIGSFSSCTLFKKNIENLQVESFLPSDSAIVFVIDHTNSGQVANLKSFFDKFSYFPDFVKLIQDEYENSDVAEKVSYEKFKTIFSGKWKFAFATQPSDSKEKLAVPYIMAVFKPENAKDFQGFLEAMMSDEFKKTVGAGGVIYWDKEEDPSAFIAKYGDFFFIANDKNKFNRSIDDAESGDGFGDESLLKKNLKELGESNFGHVYVNMKMIPQWQAQFANFEGESESSVEAIFSNSEIIEDSFGVLVTDGKSVKALGKTYLSDEGKKADIAHDLNFIKKVPVKNPIIYIEDCPLYDAIEILNNSLISWGVNVDLSQEMAEFVGVGEEAFAEFLESPFSLVVSDTGAIYPAISLYIQSGMKSLDTAKKISNFVADYLEAFFIQFGQNLGAPNILDKDVITFEGGTLTKFAVDWNDLPSDGFSELDNAYKQFTGESFGKGLSDLKIEVYSGITKDGLFVLSFYPDFSEDFGKFLMTENEDYLEIFPEIETYYGNGGFYFLSGKNLALIMAKYLDMAKNSGSVSADDYVLVGKWIEGISDFKEVVISQYVDTESIRQIIYFGTNVEQEVDAGSEADIEKVENERVKR